MTRTERITRRSFVALSAGGVLGAAAPGAGTAGRTAPQGGKPAGRMGTKMRVIGFPRDLSDASLQFVKQIGCDDVRVSAPTVAGYTQRGWLDADSARALKKRLERFGL